ncbi:MAG: phosphoribosylglycinamide formyltransferase [Deltaproteobacteria bacterium]|nr:phosphoribosylglycinamide formyltransferase [Deltaproteobacteria bacterium]
MKKILVLASGRGSNFQAIIDASRTQKIKGEIIALITNNISAKAIGRAKKHHIPVYVIHSQKNLDPRLRGDDLTFEKKLLTQCQELNPDLIVLAGYMKILPQNFIKHFKNKIINIHPALLPQFPGLHAQKQALQNGTKVSGCTVHFVDEGVDTGPIILQEKVPILGNDTEETLSDRILQKEHLTLVSAIELFCNDKLEVKEGKVYIK